uniref:S5 DRBM domain-containing protein n=1 Tax=Davidia involucrata TaxID=16924 RepID=A0A5B7C1C9_DAVIN
MAATTIIMNKSQASTWSRLILSQLVVLKEPPFTITKSHHSLNPSYPHSFTIPKTPTTTTTTTTTTHHFFKKLSFPKSHPHLGFANSGNRFFSSSSATSARTIQELLADVEREKQKEREERKRAGLDAADIDAEDEEDYMGVGPLIEKLEKEKLKDTGGDLNSYEEPTDSESEDDERFTPEAIQKRTDEFEKKFKRHEELLKNFAEADTLDDAFKWMNKIDKFEQKHFGLRPEYQVIGELMNRLKGATGKDRFLLQQKLNRAIRLVEWKEAYDPNNPANYGLIQHQQVGPSVDLLEHAGFEKEKQIIQGTGLDEDDDEEFNDMKEKDDILLEQLNAIDKKLEERLAELDHTFGKKGKVLEEEIRDLAEERNSLTEKKRRPLYRKGFDVKLIDVNRTCKVTKGGQVVKYTAMLACGNYHGIVGFAKAKGPAVPIALQKAYEKCFQNLHYVERHEEHTIAHAVQTSYKKTKVYLWPASTRTGMKAGRTVQTILNLAGFKNVKSKVIGSRNPHNTVKALFKALNAIETPKDVQEKFGRTVVESYLL